MFEDRRDIVEGVIEHLRRPVRIDAALDGRVMQDIARLETGRGSGAGLATWRWLTRPRAVRLSPLGGLAIAGGLAAVALILPGRHAGVPPAAADAARQFPFVVVAPHAGRVSLVGDFNDWDAARTPMRHSGGSVWTAVVPLAPGRYRYAFLADGSRWFADRAAPAAPDDEFGEPSSVVTVGGS